MNEKKCFVFDISVEKILVYLLLFFLFVFAKVCIFYCRSIGLAVDSDDLMVFLPSHCQVTARNYIFRYSVCVFYTNFYFCAALDK